MLNLLVSNPKPPADPILGTVTRITFVAALGFCAGSALAQGFGFPATTTAACSTDLRPEKVFVLGGVSASGLKPADVAAQLDRQMEVFARAVQDAHGILVRLERVRAISTNRTSNEQRAPLFQIVQRVRAEFSADAPVDFILNQLLLIGLDRFGDSLENNSGRQVSMPVRYAFRDFQAEMQAFRNKCRMQAEKQFCDERPEQCTDGPPKNVMTSFSARSEERVLRPEGGSNYLEWTEAGAGRMPADRTDPQLLGNLVIHMKGYYTLTAAVPVR